MVDPLGSLPGTLSGGWPGSISLPRHPGPSRPSPPRPCPAPRLTIPLEHTGATRVAAPLKQSCGSLAECEVGDGTAASKTNRSHRILSLPRQGSASRPISPWTPDKPRHTSIQRVCRAALGVCQQYGISRTVFPVTVLPPRANISSILRPLGTLSRPRCATCGYEAGSWGRLAPCSALTLALSAASRARAVILERPCAA